MAGGHNRMIYSTVEADNCIEELVSRTGRNFTSIALEGIELLSKTLRVEFTFEELFETGHTLCFANMDDFGNVIKQNRKMVGGANVICKVCGAGWKVTDISGGEQRYVPTNLKGLESCQN